MKIAQSDLLLESRHISARSQSERVAIRAWEGGRRPDFEKDRNPEGNGRVAMSRAGNGGVLLSISQSAQRAALREQLLQRPVPAPQRPESGDGSSLPLANTTGHVPAQSAVGQAGKSIASDDPRLALLIEMLEEMTGVSVRIFDASELRSGAVSVELSAQMSPPAPAAAPATAPSGWGLEMDRDVITSEQEFMAMQATGVVQTVDGQQIAVDLNLEMSREFVQRSHSTLRAGDAARIDPLVINFNGTGAQLTETRFSFDLNADGQKEDIAFVAGGSGFLVLDKNADGRINDGSELFGPAGGDGFQDLARYDSDGNHWIDENDAVFNRLQVWHRGADGKDHLSTLAETGVGALYLDRVESSFSIKKPAESQTLGVVRSSGVFLYETGQSGSIQQVDL